MVPFGFVNSNSYEDSYNSLVKIQVDKKGVVGTGTGFFINKHAQLLTNYHVVKDMKRISWVKHYADNNKLYESSEVNLNCIIPEYDIAVLSLNMEEKKKESLSHIKINKGLAELVKKEIITKPQNGGRDSGEVLGFRVEKYKKANVLFNTIKLKRQISTIVLDNRSYKLLSETFDDAEDLDGLGDEINFGVYLFDHVTAPGSSGSPVILNNGNLVAMASGGVEKVKSFAIPVEYLLKAISEPGCSDINNDLNKADADFSKLYQKLMTRYSGLVKGVTEETDIIGFVKNEYGDPVKETDVLLIKVKGEPPVTEEIGKTVTDVIGKFIFKSKKVNDGDRWKVHVSHPEYQSRQQDLQLDEATNVSIVSKKKKDLRIQVLPGVVRPAEVSTLEPEDVGFEVKVISKLNDKRYDYYEGEEFHWQLCDYRNAARCRESIEKPVWLMSIANHGVYRFIAQEVASLENVPYVARIDRNVAGDPTYVHYNVASGDDLGLKEATLRVEKTSGKIAKPKDAYLVLESGGRLEEAVMMLAEGLNGVGRIVSSGRDYKIKIRESSLLSYTVYEGVVEDSKISSIRYSIDDNEDYVLWRNGAKAEFIVLPVDTLHKLKLKKIR